MSDFLPQFRSAKTYQTCNSSDKFLFPEREDNNQMGCIEGLPPHSILHTSTVTCGALCSCIPLSISVQFWHRAVSARGKIAACFPHRMCHGLCMELDRELHEIIILTILAFSNLNDTFFKCLWRLRALHWGNFGLHFPFSQVTVSLCKLTPKPGEQLILATAPTEYVLFVSSPFRSTSTSMNASWSRLGHTIGALWEKNNANVQKILRAFRCRSSKSFNAIPMFYQRMGHPLHQVFWDFCF